MAEEAWRSAANQTVEAMPAIARMVARCGLSARDIGGVVVGLGPGSFTGLRVGLSIAKGLAVALSVPVVGIVTLDAVAYAYADRGLPVVAAISAGRGRFCAARYAHKEGAWRRVSEFQVVPIDGFALDPAGRTLFCGDLSAEAAESLRKRFADQAVVPTPAAIFRRPAYLAELGWARLASGSADDVTSLAPIYLHHTRGERAT